MSTCTESAAATPHTLLRTLCHQTCLCPYFSALLMLAARRQMTAGHRQCCSVGSVFVWNANVCGPVPEAWHPCLLSSDSMQACAVVLEGVAQGSLLLVSAAKHAEDRPQVDLLKQDGDKLTPTVLGTMKHNMLQG